MKGKRSPARISILVLALVAIAVVGVVIRNHLSQTDLNARIETAVVARRTLNATVVATGTVKAIVGAEVKVGSRISGVVAHLPVNIGSAVRKGQLIAQLDDREARSLVDQARSNLSAAQSRVAELEAGYSAQVVQSRTDIERAGSNLSAARSRYRRADPG